MILERFRHKISITSENSSKKEEQSGGLYIEPINSRWEWRDKSIQAASRDELEDNSLESYAFRSSDPPPFRPSDLSRLAILLSGI